MIRTNESLNNALDFDLIMGEMLHYIFNKSAKDQLFYSSRIFPRLE
jgi:hypothetical protein